MKKFNQSIQIEVQVDSIAAKLVNSFSEEFPHRELVAEALIGRMLAADQQGLSRLYNALHGFEVGIDFKVGDRIIGSPDLYAYWTPESIAKKETVRGKAVFATIVEINPYSDNTLTVEVEVPKMRNNEVVFLKETHHVSHINQTLYVEGV